MAAMQSADAAARAALEQRSAEARGAGGCSGLAACAVVVPARHAHALRKALDAHLGLGRDASLHGHALLAEGGGERAAVVFHVPHAAAARFSGGFPPEKLEAAFEACGAACYPGVRRLDPLFAAAGGARASARRGGDADAWEALAGLAEFSRAEAGGGARPRFSFAEIFAGVGGFRIGLEALGGVCAFAIERDARAAACYASNFANAARPDLLRCDVAAVSDASPLPAFDVLVAGFPCQPFSSRGDQPGTEDAETGGLYLELCRFLRSRRPRAFLFENVVGLAVMGGGARGHYTEDGEPEDARAPNGGFQCLNQSLV